MERALAKYSEYSFPVEMYTDAQKLYDDICSRLYFIKDASSEHTYASSYGSIYQMMALSLLFKDRKELTPEICTELGQVLSSVSDVESAGVPFELKVGFKYLVHNDVEIDA